MGNQSNFINRLGVGNSEKYRKVNNLDDFDAPTTNFQALSLVKNMTKPRPKETLDF